MRKNAQNLTKNVIYPLSLTFRSPEGFTFGKVNG